MVPWIKQTCFENFAPVIYENACVFSHSARQSSFFPKQETTCFFSLKNPANFTRSRDFCTHKNTIVNPTHQKQIEQFTSKCTGMQLLCVNSWYHNLPFVPWHCGFDRAFGSFGKQPTERVNLLSMFFMMIPCFLFSDI